MICILDRIATQSQQQFAFAPFKEIRILRTKLDLRVLQIFARIAKTVDAFNK